MNILVIGATGATGILLVQQLLNRGCAVKTIVRAADKLAETAQKNANLTIIRKPILDMTDAELAKHTTGCAGVVSCLGHTLSWRGIFGQPRHLVAQATEKLCRAIETNQPTEPVKFILMNTAGNSNRDLDEPLTLAHRCMVGMIRVVLPPHRDNENAADHLRTQVGPHHPFIRWCVVRPDTLRNDEQVTEYEVFASPTRSAIFNPGVTSRINVAHFMAELATKAPTWEQWKGQMPVIYNKK